MRNSLFAIFLFGVASVACSPAKATQSLTGTWSCEYSFEREAGKAENWWAVQYLENGTYESEGGAISETSVGRLKTEGSESGTYTVADEILSFTILARQNDQTPLEGLILEDQSKMTQVRSVLMELDESMIGTTLNRQITRLTPTHMDLLDSEQNGEELIYCERENES